MDRGGQGFGREADGALRDVAQEQGRGGGPSCRGRVAAAVRAARRIRFQAGAAGHVTGFGQVPDRLGGEAVIRGGERKLQETGEEARATIGLLGLGFF